MPPDASPSPRHPAGLPLSLPGDLRHRIAAELETMRTDMEALGVALCSDDEIMHRCMTQLQHLDEMGQRCHWLAELLRSDNPEALIPDISLQTLGERLADPVPTD